jgi:hypothetical protein
MGSKGAEGEKDDDWLLVDCHNIVVHLMVRSFIPSFTFTPASHFSHLSHSSVSFFPRPPV